jgi:hypothetical protein
MTISRGIYVYSPGTQTETSVAVEITLVGGAGGTGGNDAGTSGYAGYPGKKVNGTINVNLTDVLAISIGGGGGNGVGGASGYGGGSSGTSNDVYAGGRGGNAGGSGSSGAGGGGGAASVVKVNGSVLVVAGGGPGGGGAGNGPPGLATQGFVSSGSTAGASGTDKGGDGGGGGGGGGGNPGGAGGALQGGDSGGYSGSYGASSYPTGFTDVSATNGAGSSGTATLTYTSITGEAYFIGGRISVYPISGGSATITHTFDNNGTLVGKGATIARDVTWREVLIPQVKLNDTWTEITSAHTNINGTWKQVFPSSGNVVYSTPGVYYWTVPGGIHSITYTVVAGGGGGGGVPSPASGGGGDYNNGSPDAGGEPSGGGGGCFLAGTLITMFDRTTKSIDSIQVGDIILEALTNTPTRVIGVKTRAHDIDKWVFSLDKKTKPYITEEHPFYNDNNELCAISELATTLAPWLGTIKVVDVPNKKKIKDAVTVYNLMLETGESHYANGVRVNNIVKTGGTYALVYKGFLDHTTYEGHVHNVENQSVDAERQTLIFNYTLKLTNYILHNDNLRSRLLGQLLSYALRNRDTLYPYLDKWFKSRVRRWIFGKTV